MADFDSKDEEADRRKFTESSLRKIERQYHFEGHFTAKQIAALGKFLKGDIFNVQ